MSAPWPYKSIGEIAQHSLGKMLDRAKNRGISRPYLRNLNVRWFEFALDDVLEMRFLAEEEDRYTVRKGDLVICEGGYPGRAAIWNDDKPIHFQKALHRVRFHEPERAKWTLYYLYCCDLDGSLRQNFNGAGIQHFTREALGRFRVPLPPMAEQRRIVAILDKAFESIAIARANAEKNLQNARDLFRANLHSVFSGSNRDWAQSTIGAVCTLRSGSTLPPRIERAAGEIPYLKVADMNLTGNSDGVTTSSRFVNKADVSANNFLPAGTTIFPKRGGAILTNKKRITRRPICADLNIMGVIPKPGLLPEFLFYFFQQLDLREINSGSSIPQINNYNIEPLLISFPKSIELQQAIADRLTQLSAQTKRLESIYERKLAALDELKQSLLHHAFSGQL